MINTSGLRVLVVEDNAESRAAAIEEILRALPQAQISWAADSESAMALVESIFFDLAVCDLKIPARHGEITTQESHGLAVIGALQARQPGTPIIILSGYGTVQNVGPYAAGAEVLPAYGVPRLPMCQAAVKGDPNGFEAQLAPISGGMVDLSAVVLVSGPDLDPMLERAIAQFAVSHQYSQADVAKATGLSGSVNAIVVMRSAGKPPKRVFVKVNDREWLLDEVARQKQFVEGSLDSSNWAPTLDLLKAGLRGSAAYFSSLATDPIDLFSLSEIDDSLAVDAIDRLTTAVVPWRLSDVVGHTVGDLRRLHFPDDAVARLGFDLSEFAEVEAAQVDCTRAVIHGDLHGENVLVVEGTRPVLVDFAYTEVGPAMLDPVTLEMSFLFHPSSPAARDGRAIQYDRWAEGDYLPDNRQQATVQRCRSWAFEGRSSPEFLAVSYAHAIRHLKRGDTVDPAHALAVARSAAFALMK